MERDFCNLSSSVDQNGGQSILIFCFWFFFPLFHYCVGFSGKRTNPIPESSIWNEFIPLVSLTLPGELFSQVEQILQRGFFFVLVFYFSFANGVEKLKSPGWNHWTTLTKSNQTRFRMFCFCLIFEFVRIFQILWLQGPVWCLICGTIEPIWCLKISINAFFTHSYLFHRIG